jgi:hypothetical protein
MIFLLWLAIHNVFYIYNIIIHLLSFSVSSFKSKFHFLVIGLDLTGFYAFLFLAPYFYYNAAIKSPLLLFLFLMANTS